MPRARIVDEAAHLRRQSQRDAVGVAPHQRHGLAHELATDGEIDIVALTHDVARAHPIDVARETDPERHQAHQGQRDAEPAGAPSGRRGSGPARLRSGLHLGVVAAPVLRDLVAEQRGTAETHQRAECQPSAGVDATRLAMAEVLHVDDAVIPARDDLGDRRGLDVLVGREIDRTHRCDRTGSGSGRRHRLEIDEHRVGPELDAVARVDDSRAIDGGTVHQRAGGAAEIDEAELTAVDLEHRMHARDGLVVEAEMAGREPTDLHHVASDTVRADALTTGEDLERDGCCGHGDAPSSLAIRRQQPFAPVAACERAVGSSRRCDSHDDRRRSSIYIDQRQLSVRARYFLVVRTTRQRAREVVPSPHGATEGILSSTSRGERAIAETQTGSLPWWQRPRRSCHARSSALAISRLRARTGR
ncbi:MAG: hypothetical protein IPK74_10755 [Deltaproteobacteria bacterium]|nr:hypothetical protein [Deltaproteobacteria bacterium]